MVPGAEAHLFRISTRAFRKAHSSTVVDTAIVASVFLRVLCGLIFFRFNFFPVSARARLEFASCGADNVSGETSATGTN